MYIHTILAYVKIWCEHNIMVGYSSMFDIPGAEGPSFKAIFQQTTVCVHIYLLPVSTEHCDIVLHDRFAEQDFQHGPKGVIDCKILPRVISRQQQLTYIPPRAHPSLISSSKRYVYTLSTENQNEHRH